MTKVIHDFGEGAKKEAVMMVSLDVNFISNKFPDYKIGPNNIIIEPEENLQLPSLKDIVAKETAQLLEQQRRLSVRDIAKKFENGLATAKLTDEAKWREPASLDRQVLLKKLRDVLESLRGRVAGRNKDDADEAISMVEALAVQLTQREGELLHEKAEVKKLANFFKQVSEDAKRIIEEERANARTEIETARAAVQRIEQVLEEQEQSLKSEEKQELEELMKEVQEARRIKMLHQPSRVKDMEHELQGLRIQLAEKSLYCIKLRKELELNRMLEENRSQVYELQGPECLGSCLHIIPRTAAAPDISIYSIQWYRILPEGSKRELISGADKPVYAPEPFDVGQFLQAEMILNDEKVTVTTAGPIDSAAGLGSYVESLARKSDSEFKVVVVQMNGNDYSSQSVHVFHVGKLRIKLCKGWSTKAKESYSTSMQLCGVRGGGNAAVQSLFWQARKGLSYTLAFESVRERNAAIMLARRFAFDCNIMLAGPDDRTSVGT
ncbi:stomatal closure-related actin-binding protein 1 [Iris pallida]|uniref:Stomatal closure-related actin-binding protein 1 n=1 Tax=Iris pallida TaxID=29817 RepID=A0AAX6EUF8_IRIPA|nr:stomatal closure-related actin-binding protein 1 [Iris pallida]